MKITEKQREEFNNERKNLLEKINFFEQGVNFAENWCKSETGKKQWIACLKNAINSTNCIKEDLGDVEYAIAISEYLRKIEIVILKEFTYSLKPFDVAIPEYRKKVYNILLGIEID